jgi:predicted transposase/invertase (TIGR01784 family)
MKHRIDPKIDCVFKALLGSEQNRNLLVHFLNAILVNDLAAPITDVEILNPYNDKEFLDDKFSVVDVKARDNAGGLYQIEIQLLNHHYLLERMVYTWCDIVSQQLQGGEDYRLLKPVYSIWLLAENLLSDDTDYAHEYALSDRRGRKLGNVGSIHLLELKKFAAEPIETEQQRWLKFFKDGEQLDDAVLPDWMNTQEMRQAMTTLRMFSEKERDYHAYQARQNFLRVQRIREDEMEEALREKQEALGEKQAAMEREHAAIEREQTAKEREQAALQEIERLKALLEESQQK